jgi:hypothetical protein
MPKGVYDRNPKDGTMPQVDTSFDAAAVNPQPEVKAPAMFPVFLIKNYAPMGAYEIVGYLKEAVKQKDAAGNWRVIEKEEFVEGQMKPPPSPGVGFPDKVWAGTTIRLPVDEAKSVVAKKIAERADAISA